MEPRRAFNFGDRFDLALDGREPEQWEVKGLNRENNLVVLYTVKMDRTTHYPRRKEIDADVLREMIAPKPERRAA